MREFAKLEDFNIGDKVRIYGGKLVGTVSAKYTRKIGIDYPDGRYGEAYPAEVEKIAAE
jgi:hypothetical protein